MSWRTTDLTSELLASTGLSSPLPNSTDSLLGVLTDRILQNRGASVLGFFLRLTQALVPLPNTTGPYLNNTVPVPISRYRYLLNDYAQCKSLLALTLEKTCPPPKSCPKEVLNRPPFNFNPRYQTITILEKEGFPKVSNLTWPAPVITAEMRGWIQEAALWGAQIGFALVILIVLMMAHYRRDKELQVEEERKRREKVQKDALTGPPDDERARCHFERKRPSTGPQTASRPPILKEVADGGEEEEEDDEKVKKTLPLNLAYPLSVIAIFIVICKAILQLARFWGPYGDWILTFTFEYSLVAKWAKVRISLSTAVALIHNAVIYGSLWFQLRSALDGDLPPEDQSSEMRAKRWTCLAVHTAASIADTGLYAFVTYRQWKYLNLSKKEVENLVFLGINPFTEIYHIAHKVFVLFIIFFFSAICVSKLWKPLKFKIRQYKSWNRAANNGAKVSELQEMSHKMSLMQFMFVLTFQSMVIPLILTALELANKVPKITMLIPALMSFSLPLCNIWIRLSTVPKKPKTRKCKTCKKIHVFKEKPWDPAIVPGTLDPEEALKAWQSDSSSIASSNTSVYTDSSCPEKKGEGNLREDAQEDEQKKCSEAYREEQGGSHGVQSKPSHAKSLTVQLPKASLVDRLTSPQKLIPYEGLPSPSVQQGLIPYNENLSKHDHKSYISYESSFDGNSDDHLWSCPPLCTICTTCPLCDYSLLTSWLHILDLDDLEALGFIQLKTIDECSIIDGDSDTSDSDSDDDGLPVFLSNYNGRRHSDPELPGPSIRPRTNSYQDKITYSRYSWSDEKKRTGRNPERVSFEPRRPASELAEELQREIVSKRTVSRLRRGRSLTRHIPPKLPLRRVPMGRRVKRVATWGAESEGEGRIVLTEVGLVSPSFSSPPPLYTGSVLPPYIESLGNEAPPPPPQDWRFPPEEEIAFGEVRSGRAEIAQGVENRRSVVGKVWRR